MKVSKNKLCNLPRRVIEDNSESRFFESLNSGEVEDFGADEWYTTEEAAAFLKVSPYYLRNLSSNGLVPYYKLQRRNRYKKSDLVKILLGNRKGGPNGI